MEEKRYKVYQRGEIIYADFGKGVGHEFSYKHFCIVINKKDNKNNGKVTVIPLTSKSKHNAFVNIHLIKPFLIH
ncbi:type II toxin-antitoxin system PemK/MazF family toxin [Staphylococcus aureus]|nr:type II toxin-antitoxin system PemK/MazF family toxin [Staphylococcus aureus]WRN72422.1 type II toxin-antitoxin system PemK/MazF family toxin [Staphylococcus aureus]